MRRCAEGLLVRGVTAAEAGRVREGLALIREAFDQTSVGLTLVSLEGEFFLVNRAFCELSGFSREELVGKSCCLVSRPEDVELDKASRKLVYSVTLSTDTADFAVGKYELPDAAKARIDELVTRVKADGQNVFFEIEGHTDSTGPKELNDKLGLQRAEAAMRYLRDQHQIPLFKISVISYGADKPVAPNKTKADRAQNRRIVINVLS